MIVSFYQNIWCTAPMLSRILHQCIEVTYSFAVKVICNIHVRNNLGLNDLLFSVQTAQAVCMYICKLVQPVYPPVPLPILVQYSDTSG